MDFRKKNSAYIQFEWFLLRDFRRNNVEGEKKKEKNVDKKN